jgi:hypothetical protein
LSWSAKLAKPLKPRDHAELVTLGNARDYMLKLPDAVASCQLNRALFLPYQEDMGAKPR